MSGPKCPICCVGKPLFQRGYVTASGEPYEVGTDSEEMLTHIREDCGRCRYKYAASNADGQWEERILFVELGGYILVDIRTDKWLNTLQHRQRAVLEAITLFADKEARRGFLNPILISVNKRIKENVKKTTRTKTATDFVLLQTFADWMHDRHPTYELQHDSLMKFLKQQGKL